MCEQSISTVAEEYFGTLNSIAARIHNDINETILAYESLWNTLQKNEQLDIINESIIKPEVCLKYASITPSEEDEQYCDKDIRSYHNNLATGLKIVHDESSSYRDEHSAPFNVKTKSQLNLNIFGNEECNKYNVSKIRSPPPVKIDNSKINIKPESILTHSSGLINSTNNESESFMSKLMNKKPFMVKGKRDDEELLVTEKAAIVFSAKDNALTPKTPEEKLGLLDGNDVKITGYDFLDNW